MDPHGIFTIKGGKITLERVGQSKILQNGRVITIPIEINHLDR